MRHPCATPGCATLTAERLCETCRKTRGTPTRATAAKRGYGYRWQKTSRAYLAAHPVCADPDGRHPGRLAAATVTDHVVPHKGDMALFWEPNNWQPLCASCHARKTLAEGSFGR